MRSIIIALLVSVVLNIGYGQQERQYSQFMYNKLAINPAFAGALPSTSFGLLYRNQWMGFEGSPVTQSLSANIPFLDQRVGVGANLIHSTIGISDMWTLSGMYAYRLPMGNGFISGGLEGSIRYYGVDYSNNSLRADQNLAADNAVLVENNTKVVPNLGLGAYYADKSFYIGVSAPRLLQSNIDFNDALLISREVIHFYLMSGYSIEANEELFFTPQVNLKFAKNSPVSLDANLMVDFGLKYNAGVSYRTGGINSALGESIDILFGMKVIQPLFLGLSYDIQIGDLGRYNKGSIECFLRYSLPGEYDVDVQNPRFF